MQQCMRIRSLMNLFWYLLRYFFHSKFLQKCCNKHPHVSFKKNRKSVWCVIIVRLVSMYRSPPAAVFQTVWWLRQATPKSSLWIYCSKASIKVNVKDKNANDVRCEMKKIKFLSQDSYIASAKRKTTKWFYFGAIHF